ncbi:amino acid ABC transporter permease [Candidatus Aerophobetes bacterium]|uniref:Amino acid ABC transporter permease n=1 Tax=Aerophobetes bacterium TaxID=2030807 RepID=A0A7V5LYQ4_UNCAE|nr:amino acid ABC transporter permease [Candidatus Aerophobetes bacterium]HHF98281.1 amino acid ABC transporter permease [Candidatus Aerophobetes bacterium]
MLDLVKEIMPQLLEGTLVTLQLTGTAISLGFIIGIFLALGRLYGKGPVRAFCKGYIEFFRGTPLLVQLFIVYYGLPRYGIKVSSVLAAFLGLGLNSAAYQAEYFRGAIQSIPGGQMMAARAIGMTKFKAILNVIIPQALRVVIPSWSNELIYTLKYSSVAYIIGAPELMAQAKFITAENFRYFEVFLVVAFIYLVIVSILSWVLRIVEKKVKIPGLQAV